MSTLYVDNLQPNLGSKVEIPDLKPLAGAVVQVVQGSYGDATVVNSTTYTSIGLSVNITPTSTSSKILISYDVHAAAYGGSESAHLRIYRDSTSVYVGNTRGSRTPATSAVGGDASSSAIYMQSNTYLDSPSTTSQITYEIKCRSYDGGGGNQAYVNRSYTDSNFSSIPSVVSTITVMEIAQ